MDKRIIRVIMFICIAIDFLFIIGVEYVDSVINCSWGYAFWDVVFRKTDCSMYEYLMSNAISPYEAPMGYSWLVELPIALWELPIYALYTMMGKTIVYNSLLLYWYKLLLIIISMGIIFVGLKCANVKFSARFP